MIKEIKHLVNLFCTGSDFIINESFNDFSISCTSTDLNVPDQSSLKSACIDLKTYDRIELLISIDKHEPVSIYLNKVDQLSSFLLDVEATKEQKIINSSFEVQVNIYKEIVNSTVNVYSYSEFLEYLSSISLSALLHSFNRLICKEQVNTFLFINEEIKIITKTFKFVSKSDSPSNTLSNSFDREGIIRERAEVCSFNQSSELQLIPQDFQVINSSGSVEELRKLISKVSVIVSFSYLADISELQNQDSFFFKINGYKSITNTVRFDDISADQSDDTFKIFRWVYSDGGTNDKLGLARNLISMTIDTETLKIDESTLPSILSNYEIYLKKNVQNYIQLKVKISDFLDKADAKANDLVVSFGKTFRNNLVAFIGYFFTVIIVRYVNSGNLDVLFTAEVAYLSLAFLGASFIILLLTIWDSINERDRLIALYHKTKKRYKYLLDESDLKRIFSNDEEHNNDIRYINIKVLVYSLVWGASIVAFTLIVLCMSDF